MPMPAAIASSGEAKATARPLDRDRAGVGGIKTVEHAHQRALAGAVLAEQRQHLAGADVEVDVIVGDDAAEPLDDAAHGNERRRTVARPGHLALLRLVLSQSTTKMASTSTAAPRGRVATPTAVREWLPRSPNSSQNRSDAPLMTCGTFS